MVISFEEFKNTIQVIKDHDNFCHVFSKFLESKICEQSYCMVTIGDKLVNCIIKNLCREFDIPLDMEYIGNEIEWWLWEDADKIIYFRDDTQLDVSDIKDFYDYLVKWHEYAKK